MAQATLKASMEDDPLPFEEEKDRFINGGLEEGFDIPDFPDDPDGSFDQINLNSPKERETTPSFSLDDDFPDFVRQEERSDEEEKKKAEPTTSSKESKTGEATEQNGIKRKIKAKKILLISIACLSVVISSVIALKLLSGEKRYPIPPPPPQKKVLKRAVPIEYRQEQIELLFIASSQSSRDFVLFELELDFLSLNAHEEYKKNDILFRDMIYRYLKSQQPAKNSLKYWQEILEKGLLTHVKSTFPHSGVTSIRVTHLDRL